MSTIKSSSEHLTLNADGASKDIKFQANGVEKASISSAGAFTSTTIDATALTGALPALDGSSLTGVGGGVQSAFNIRISGNQAVSAATYTKVPFNTEDLDDGGNFDNATNYRYTCPSTGKYLLQANLSFLKNGDTRYLICALYKNGSSLYESLGGHIQVTEGDSTLASSLINVVVSANATDYFEVYAYATQTVTVYVGGTQFSGCKLY